MEKNINAISNEIGTDYSHVVVFDTTNCLQDATDQLNQKPPFW